MNTYADRKNENKSYLSPSIISQKKSSGVSTFQLIDNRPAGVILQKQVDAMEKAPIKSIIQKKRIPRVYPTI